MARSRSVSPKRHSRSPAASRACHVRRRPRGGPAAAEVAGRRWTVSHRTCVRPPAGPTPSRAGYDPSMLGGGQRRLVLVASSALVIAGLFGAPARTEALPPYGQVSFRAPSLFPKF